jgi:hypothetical protein
MAAAVGAALVACGPGGAGEPHCKPKDSQLTGVLQGDLMNRSAWEHVESPHAIVWFASEGQATEYLFDRRTHLPGQWLSQGKDRHWFFFDGGWSSGSEAQQVEIDARDVRFPDSGVVLKRVTCE